MFNAFILPILLYNCGTWSLTKTGKKKLDAFHRSLLHLLQRVIGIFWPEKISNKELYCKNNQKKLSSTIRNKRLTSLKHIPSLSPDSPAQTSTDAYFQAPTKLTRGRPKTIIVSVLQNDLKSLNNNLNKLEDLHKIRTTGTDNK